LIDLINCLGLGAGFSAAWWRSQHNRHHAMPQRINHDVELFNTLPLLAFSKQIMKDPKSDVNFFLKHQSKLFMLVAGLIVFSFWRLYLAPRYALRKREYLDLIFCVLHFFVPFSFIPIHIYLLGAIVGGNYLIFNFALSHTHLPVAEEPKHWIEYCLTHTVDIEPSWWCDWFMGYLNYQIVSGLLSIKFAAWAVSD